jgi:hypothetical protein
MSLVLPFDGRPEVFYRFYFHMKEASPYPVSALGLPPGELQGYCGQDLSPYARSLDHRKWFVKAKPGSPEEKLRDRLAYLLGRGWVNVAEVRLVDQALFCSISEAGPLREGATADSTCVVRLACDHDLAELPLRALDEAVAGELVFSLWIRRRDTHPFNRAYVQGVPVFFDHQTAFLGEAPLQDIEVFFETAQKSDAGYGGLWRIQEIPSNTKPSTRETREDQTRRSAHGDHKSIHMIYNKGTFFEHLRLKAERIHGYSDEVLFHLCQEAGFDTARGKQVADFLATNRDTLNRDLKELEATVLGQR